MQRGLKSRRIPEPDGGHGHSPTLSALCRERAGTRAGLLQTQPGGWRLQEGLRPPQQDCTLGVRPRPARLPAQVWSERGLPGALKGAAPDLTGPRRGLFPAHELPHPPRPRARPYLREGAVWLELLGGGTFPEGA